jgi:hypothetical protein
LLFGRLKENRNFEIGSKNKSRGLAYGSNSTGIGGELMPIGLGLCASHAPSLFFSTYEGWERMHHILNDGHPQPHETELEDRATIEDRIPRIKNNYGTLRKKIEDYGPDSLIVVLGDQREWFGAGNIPNIAIYTGPSSWGYHCTDSIDGQREDTVQGNNDYRVPVRTDEALSKSILAGLIQDGFDVGNLAGLDEEQQALGVPHGWSNLIPHILPDPNNPIPVVLVFVNVDDGPPVIINGERCLALGRSIANICDNTDKRIAIIGSGGMSHDPKGPRSGWVDEPLDNWFMKQIIDGTPENMKAMFRFRSENFVGGTGELRCWITVAGTIDQLKKGQKGTKVDYIAARKVTSGVGWAFWDLPPDRIGSD